MRHRQIDIASAHCGVVRECKNNACIFKMYFLGYKSHPTSELDKKKNIDFERRFGKGITPRLDYIQRDDHIDVRCSSYKD